MAIRISAASGGAVPRRPLPSWPFLILLLAAAGATAAEPLGLAEAMRLAERESPMLEARQAMRRAAGEEAAGAGSLPDPLLTVGIDNLPITGSEAGRFGVEDMTMRRIGLMQEWPLPSKRRARTADAEAAVAQAEAATVADAAEVRRAAAAAWIGRWRTSLELALIDELRVEVERAAELVERRLASGIGSASDALQARAELAALDARRLALAAEQEASAAELAGWIGAEAAGQPAAVTDFSRLPHEPDELRSAIDRHAALQPAQADRLRAERAVELARTERRPDLRFAAGYGIRSGGRPDMLMLEVGVGLPLFPRNRQDRMIAARLAEADAAQFELDDRRREQRAALERELALWQGLIAQTARYRDDLLPLARDRSRIALASIGSGAELAPWIAAHHDEIEQRMAHVGLLAELAGRWAWLATLLPEHTP